MSQSSGRTSGISGGFLLFLVFLTLKLLHVINWSWWWVTAPLWIGAAIMIGIMIVAGIIAIIIGILKK